MNSQPWDVLVVGLGPGGGAAAAAAAESGARVLAFDRKKQVGEPVQCAEFIPMALGRYAGGAGVLQQRIAGMKSILPSGAVEDSPYRGLMVDRAAFDRALATRAAGAGAELRLGWTLEGLDPVRRIASVRDGRSRRELAFRILIAADGPNSRVARLLGLPAQRVVHSRQYLVPLLKPLQETTIWLSPAYPGGYAWLFPRGETANLGVGIDFEFSRDLRHPLDELHGQLVAAGVVGAEIRRRTGGAIPVGGMRERLVLGDVLFVGDAAGLTHPITGAGISAAVLSGEEAGTAAARRVAGKSGALEDYDETIRELFGPTIERALRTRESLNWMWKTPAAALDDSQRRGWVAFEEYFAF
ncbi:MAG TPA: NAD(P)/FAD-dependent oxidoreductase [Burkholderiales bacterium]|nr:NAD(P)/FAD-dependent oxidoreductase [Burkholderiales bacterium]